MPLKITVQDIDPAGASMSWTVDNDWVIVSVADGAGEPVVLAEIKNMTSSHEVGWSHEEEAAGPTEEASRPPT